MKSAVTDVQLRATRGVEDRVSVLAGPVTTDVSADLSLALSFGISQMDSVAKHCQSLASSQSQ